MRQGQNFPCARKALPSPYRPVNWKPILFAWFVVPACSIYDESLFGPDPSDANVGGEGGSLGSIGGTPSTGGSSTGGTPSGGMGGTAGEGAGGSPPVCKGAFTDVAATSVIDDFDNSAQQTTSEYAGAWTSWGNATGLSPNQTGTWIYGQDDCFDEGDTSLHVTGDGYTQWAHFILDLEEAHDLSEFDGIIFWGKSAGDLVNSVRFTVRNGSAEQTTSTYRALARDEWRQYKLPFADGVVRGESTEFKLVLDAAASFDFWIDDLSFYRDEP